ncbi:3-ketoacyl-ACP reductase [Mesorhizobium sp. M1A.F.Ca.IN.022.07.1.1]|uniref:3-ketoacyl-ACP reductase n=1 Tax=unclassified Mesorhizobium TaxID=325217 RepID=UPI000FCABEBB|nr:MULTISPECIES: 3-ketoacyl-ACP reductase [unclassified Mesorhizobium]RUV86627.1 3-ketoacyl-ACP reductase [Mesorhizobium sp. M1A.F.Ca.IN.022.07.1.1]RWM65130.1 MAG: 3-ketoacyl-ACP reductase [Mesorhizobium sp.]RWM89593.1 MAG: 3-ketoacyl-ACP reductase [Mesorhizobium sp.]TIS71303.1 MAG: 3-ketoacyl-ACP reductase [Mesorhizobium sp.]TJV54602.1 MAG: 3-ketoacyl-ACP reductase [Mesorhizobium sp.]
MSGLEKRSEVAVVTGAAQGIGRAVCEVMARTGYAVCGLDRAFTDDSEEWEARITRFGARDAAAFPFDLNKVETHSEIVSRIAERFGAVDILINNAGIGSPKRGDMLDLTPENFDATLGVNLRGTFFLTQAVARWMLHNAAKNGVNRSIVIVSSAGADIASLERAEYCISKAALPMLTKLFALRMSAAGVNLFEVRPGIVRTAMTSAVTAKYDAAISEGIVPAGRWAEPDDIADAINALVSGAFRFATGSHVFIDGGLSIQRL